MHSLLLTFSEPLNKQGNEYIDINGKLDDDDQDNDDHKEHGKSHKHSIRKYQSQHNSSNK